ncbi:unnamed protein product [Ilex paraguariensis]|uniref:Uncharacterized protein n=1 Tax=Ilex paraguariensis TaxID=185542 RepID=A0ABC8UYB6_9AQUA
MGEFAVVPPCYKNSLTRTGAHFCGWEWKGKPVGKWQCRDESRPQPLTIKSQTAKLSTYSSSISTDCPLFESPQASFDQYLEDKPRVFKAIFPEKQGSQQLNEEEWKIYMLPIKFLFLTAWPVIDLSLRCKSEGIDYPPGVPRDISKVLELDIIRWELQGLNDILKPSQFDLGVKGALYRDSQGTESRLKGAKEIGGEHEGQS